MNGELPITVLCVDDSDLVSGAVATKLRMAGGFTWIGRLESADDLVSTALRDKPAVILLDIDMPGRDPFDAIRDLVDQGVESRVVVFSGHARQELLSRAIEAGVWGYVSKSDGEDAMIEGIRSVASGEFVLSPEVRAIFERA